MSQQQYSRKWKRQKQRRIWLEIWRNKVQATVINSTPGLSSSKFSAHHRMFSRWSRGSRLMTTPFWPLTAREWQVGTLRIRGIGRYHWERAAGLGAEWVPCLGTLIAPASSCPLWIKPWNDIHNGSTFFNLGLNSSNLSAMIRQTWVHDCGGSPSLTIYGYPYTQHHNHQELDPM